MADITSKTKADQIDAELRTLLKHYNALYEEKRFSLMRGKLVESAEGQLRHGDLQISYETSITARKETPDTEPHDYSSPVINHKITYKGETVYERNDDGIRIVNGDWEKALNALLAPKPAASRLKPPTP